MPKRAIAASSRSTCWSCWPCWPCWSCWSCLIAAVAFALDPRAAASGADTAARVSFVEVSHSDAAGPAVTAVGLRATGDTAAVSAPPTEVVILIDTSASQTGDHRQRSLEALAGILEGARETDRFLAAAVDVACGAQGGEASR